MKRNILLLIISVMLAGAARGQQATDTTVVYYRQGYSVVELTLRNNRAALEGFLNRFNASMQDSTLHLVSFRLDAYASPEGTAAANDRLSENRAKRLAEYICSRTGLSESDLTIEGHGIDWEQLEEKTAASDVPYKEEVLDVLRNTPEWIYDEDNRIIDGRKHRLGMLRGGVPYNYLSEHIFPLLRRSCITLSYTVEPLEQPAEEQPAEERPAAEQPEQPREEVAAQPDPAPISTPVPAADKREFRPLLAVKTNLLYWATVMPDFKSYTFVPNLEIEYFFKERWSLSGTVDWAKWGYGGGDFFGISSYSLEPRWWFKGDGRFRRFYLGAYGQVGDYDAQNARVANDGNTGRLWGAGLSLGVAIPFSDRFGLEVGIRGGYRRSNVRTYSHEAPDYFLDYETKDNHWGVTGIKASLYFRFGKGSK